MMSFFLNMKKGFDMELLDEFFGKLKEEIVSSFAGNQKEWKRN